MLHLKTEAVANVYIGLYKRGLVVKIIDKGFIYTELKSQLVIVNNTKHIN